MVFGIFQQGKNPWRFLFFILVSFGVFAQEPAQDPKNEVARVLDTFHDAAAKADADRYFGQLAHDAVFLGTDADERWTGQEFGKAYRSYMESGKGWTYLPRDRFIYLTPDGKTAWFDEMLSNDAYGVCRGSGVLALRQGGWKIVQYNLSIPMPNELTREFVARIRAEKK